MTHGLSLTMGSAESLGLACSAEECQGWGSPLGRHWQGWGDAPLPAGWGWPQLMGAQNLPAGAVPLEETHAARSVLLYLGHLPQEGLPAWVPLVPGTPLAVGPDWSVPCIIKAAAVGGLSTVSLEILRF